MELEEITPLIAIVGVFGAWIGLITQHFHTIGGIQERVARLEQKGDQLPINTAEIRKMIEDMAEMKTKIGLFWGALEEQLPGLLLKGNPISPDSEIFHLLEKYQKKEIADEECPKLIELLKQEAQDDSHQPGEKLAMVLTIAVVKATTKECRMYHEVLNRV